MNARIAILCVDDERIILDSLKNEVIAYFGDKLYCEIAESGEEALAVMEELIEEGYSIPLVISDCIMQNGMDGTEFLAKVRAFYKSTFCVLLTGQTRNSNEVTSSHTYHKIVTKPWNADELLTIVNKTICTT